MTRPNFLPSFSGATHTPENLARVLDQISLSRLVSHLEATLVDPGQLREMSDASYVHQLGFSKIVLGRQGDAGSKVRLHLWNRAHPADYGDIHNHAWGFASRVLYGAIEEATYRETADEGGGKYWKYRYSPRREKDHFVLERIGPSNLIEVDTGTKMAGDIYWSDHTAIHAARNPTLDVTITLFLTTSAARLESDVFLPYGHKERFRRDCPSLGIAALRSCLELAVQKLSSAAGR